MSESKDPYGTAPDPGWGQPGQPYPQQPYGQQPYAGPPPMRPEAERTWGGAAHWTALIGGLFFGFAFLGPLLVLLVKGNESPWVRRQAVESLNFQLSMLIYAVVSGVLVLLLVGLLLLLAVAVVWFVLTIVGSVKAANGEDYRYPLTIRLVS